MQSNCKSPGEMEIEKEKKRERKEEHTEGLRERKEWSQGEVRGKLHKEGLESETKGLPLETRVGLCSGEDQRIYDILL